MSLRDDLQLPADAWTCVSEKYRHLAGLPPELIMCGIADQSRREQMSKEALSTQQCACKKVKPVSVFPIYNTGHVYALDTVCVGCRKQFENFARIVCANCKVPVMFVQAHVDDAGFEFKPGKTYHVTACPACNEHAKIAVPVEKIAFDYVKSGRRVSLSEFTKLTLNR